VPLAEPGYVAVHAMVLEETFWDVVEGIRACGGTDILVTPVEKFLR
jgi:ATP phosphoribosyltransferase